MVSDNVRITYLIITVRIIFLVFADEKKATLGIKLNQVSNSSHGSKEAEPGFECRQPSASTYITTNSRLRRFLS